MTYKTFAQILIGLFAISFLIGLILGIVTGYITMQDLEKLRGSR